VRQISNSSVGISSCIDSATAENPSCGWTLDASGFKIPDSQGFCSNRDLLDLKTCGDAPAPWRGDEMLGPLVDGKPKGEQSTLTNSFSTAYCLRQGDIFFAGFEIDTPHRNYKVDAVVTKGTDVFTTFSLSPQTPIYLDKTSVHQIKAELLGEARPPVAAPDLSGYILYVPVSPTSHPMVTEVPGMSGTGWQNNMLLVPRNMITIDGSECNKVGTSFAAFRKQQGGSAPTTVAGDCLGNQLYQLHQEDLAKLAGNPNAETRFLTSGMKMFKSAASFNDMSLQLVVGSPELNYSTIALELDNAQIGSIANEANAWIKEASCQPFYSMSKQGTMKVTVENVGSVESDYIVRLHDCQPGIIEPIPPQAKPLQAGDIFTLIFDIMTSVSMEGEHYCMVTLQSPHTARIYDEVKVFFDTHPYISKTASQWQQERRSKDSKKAN